MDKLAAKRLKSKADEVAEKFSRKDRPGNFNGETFYIHGIRPLSSATALVFYLKNTGKYAMALFYYIRSVEKDKKTGNKIDKSYWCYFFPTESHVLGLERVGRFLERVDASNFYKNF